MIANKTFYGQSLVKKPGKLSPQKERPTKKQQRPRLRSIVKLPSVRNHPALLETKDYEIGQLIGEGAYARVYYARRLVDSRKCVIKVIDKNSMQTEERRKALRREIEALNIPPHQNLAHCLEHFEAQDKVAIVMEFFSRCSLAEFVKNYPSRQLQNFVLQSIAKQTCEGLLHLHRQGMSHRDIKPENILIDEQTLQIKIIDFGFATSPDLVEVVVAGTPQYMAPQLLARRNYDPLKADIWALGIMLYWLACGFFPQDADKRKRTSVKRGDEFSLQFPASINPGLEYLLTKMLNPNPKDRVDLEAILEDTWIKPKSFKAQIDRLKLGKPASSVSAPT